MFNFSGTRLHFQGYSSKDNFSSLTIHAVIYLLNKYLLRAHYCQGISKSDQQPLLARLPSRPGVLCPWHCGRVTMKPACIRKARRLRPSPLQFFQSTFSCVACSQVFVVSVLPERKQYVHAFSSCKEVFPREVVKEKTDVSFQAFVLKCKIIISVF